MQSESDLTAPIDVYSGQSGKGESKLIILNIADRMDRCM